MKKLDRRIFDDDISISLSPINQYSSKVIEEDSKGLSCIFEENECCM